MRIRQLEKEEHGKTRALYEEVFSGDSASFVDYYYTEKTKDNRIYVAEQDGEICSMLHLNPYTLMVQGDEKQSYYIVAVATKKDFRKQGFMRALLCRAMRDLYKEGILFAYLMPVREKIYLPFGFRTVYEQKRPIFRMEDPGAGDYEAAGLKDCGAMAKAAEQFLAGHYQVFAKRTEKYYRRLIKECASEQGKVMVRWEKGERKGRKAQDIRLYYPEEEDAPAKIMVRVTDARRLLTGLQAESPMSACFHITDPLIPENNCCLHLLGPEASRIQPMDGKPENSEGTVPVSSLAGLVFGARSVEEISRERGTVMTERLKEELKKIVPLSGIYLNEAV